MRTVANHCQLLHLFNYLLTPCSRARLEKLTDSQLVKKFLAFCGTRRFINAFTSAHHLSLPTRILVQFRGTFVCFLTASFYGEELSAPFPTPKLEDHSLLASATSYSIYLQLPSILDAVPIPYRIGAVKPILYLRA